MVNMFVKQREKERERKRVVLKLRAVIKRKQVDSHTKTNGP